MSILPREGSALLGGWKSSLVNLFDVEKKASGQKSKPEKPLPLLRGIISAKIAPPHIFEEISL